MTNVGRNTPCPCGSGRKYKHCCLALHEAARHEQRRVREAQAASFEAVLAEEQELNDLSNSVLPLIKAGKLDEAEGICDELERRYPDQIDGLERRARVFEARGDRKQAALYFRKALAHAKARDGFEEESCKWLQDHADALDPPTLPQRHDAK